MARVAISCSGGTALVAFQAPIAEHLDASHDVVAAAGISSGSLTARLLAEGRIGVLREELLRLRGRRDFAGLRWWEPWGGLYNLHPLLRRLEARRVGDHDALVPCWAGVVDVRTRQYRNAPTHTMAASDVRDALIASSTQPKPVMAPAYLKGRRTMDGGAGGHLIPPMPPSVLEGVDEWHLLCSSPLGGRRLVFPDRDDDAYEEAEAAFQLLMARQAHEDVEDHRRAAQEWGVRLVVWSPPSWEAIGKPFDASRRAIRSRLAVGEITVREAA